MAARWQLITSILAAGLALSGCDDDAVQVGEGDALLDGGASDASQTLDGGQVTPDGGDRPDARRPDAAADGAATDVEVPPDGPDPDAAIPTDTGLSADTGTPVDDGVPPVDEGLPPPDEGHPGDDGLPVDVGVPPADLGPDAACRFDCDNDGISAGDGDCDDNDPTVFPGAPEICDGLDNNCDGPIDGNAEQCYTGPAGTRGQGVCRAGQRRCVAGEFGACAGETVPGPEACGDGLDGDCDGTVDEGCDGDDDGFTISDGDCRDDDPAINPGANEVCDGVDNDCDAVIDGNADACYSGPAGTEGVGICIGGASTCVDGVFGECAGEVLPQAQDACGNLTDDDCDGDVDEGCDVAACPDVDLNSRVYLTSSCLAVESGAIGLVVVELRDNDGNPMPDADVEITAAPAVRMDVMRTANDARFRIVFPNNVPTVERFTVTVGCDNGNRLALNTVPVMNVVPSLAAGRDLVTGGCPAIEGAVQITATDAGTGLPISGAWMMAGDRETLVYQHDAQQALRGRAGRQSNVARTADNGRARLRDLGGTLVGPQTITVGAEGYENVTLTGVNASVLVVPLRPAFPPAPARATIRGQMTEFDDLRPDGEADAGLAVGSFDLPFLAQLDIPRLLSRSDCWDPVTRGFVAGFVDPVPVPGNLYVPEQSEIIFGVNVTIEEHPITLSDVPLGVDNIVGISGKVPSQEVVDLLVGGGDISSLLELLELQEIGVARDVNVAGDIDDLDVPLNYPLVANGQCVASNVPANADLACVSAGDWSGANGTGRLFPMGVVNVSAEVVDDARPGPTRLPATTVAPVEDFANIGYLGVVVAIYTGGDDGDLDNAVSAVLDRSTLGPAGGDMVVDSFFTPPTLSRDNFDITWDPVGNANSPDVDVCRVEVVRTIQETYQPGACVQGNYVKTREVPVWTGYVGTDSGALSLPQVPAAWPRGDIAGFVDPAATPERDYLTLRVTCLGLGLAPDFAFNASNFRALVNGLTHVTANSINF